MKNEQKQEFGVGDASYKAAGALDGITALVDEFYNVMNSLPEAKRIRAMHPGDLEESRKKLSYFLSGWLGGPRLYSQNFGKIILPEAHKHLPIGESERDAWMLCMEKAIAKQPYTDEFKKYLYKQLMVPAERTRVVCQRHRQEGSSEN
ncbi:MAG: group II truncated hemoglobin [Pseudomonadales bacterium]|nr:group II truncated hemoglobin [Pseudomonadales bacterium]